MDKYTEIKEVGAGAFGKAVLVKDVNKKEFIIKVIDISAMSTKERHDAVNEVKLLSTCKHPYIITYRESFIDKGKLCIVMDYADGGDLAGRIKKQKASGKPFTEDQILRWFTQALLSLRYMHEKHILHRDLKTQNFFLMSNGRLRVGDFGIAKVLESTVAFAKTQIGTPYYLSPEICTAQPYSYSSDIWALGCVLFELAALKVPFDGANIKSLMKNIVDAPAPAIPSQYSAELREICALMLNKDSKKRPTCEDLCKKKIIQDTIRSMLEEENKKEPSTPVKGGMLPPQKGGTPAMSPKAQGTPLKAPVSKGTPSKNRQ